MPSFHGSSVTYAAGGGAWGNSTRGTGGSSIGGNGGQTTSDSPAPTAGATNTGSGGGGGAGSAGYGGSGIVILSVPTTNYSGTTTGSPTITTSGSNKIITFTASVEFPPKNPILT